MQISLNTSKPKWYDRLWAAFIFFTRLPLWRIHQPPKEAYTSVVEFWPLAGWLTGGVMAGTLWIANRWFSIEISIIFAIIARLLLTGALHEDGLADFLDGFGAGGDRERILGIMKDSHIGTYGVLGLIFYYLIFYNILVNISNDIYMLMFFMVAADSYSKMLAGQIVQFLPYARNEETAKSGVVYRKFSTPSVIFYFLQGILPMLGILYLNNFFGWHTIIFGPCFTLFFLYYLMAHKIGGYTGDCCGALFLLCELTCYVMAIV